MLRNHYTTLLPFVEHSTVLTVVFKWVTLPKHLRPLFTVLSPTTQRVRWLPTPVYHGQCGSPAPWLSVVSSGQVNAAFDLTLSAWLWREKTQGFRGHHPFSHSIMIILFALLMLVTYAQTQTHGWWIWLCFSDACILNDGLRFLFTLFIMSLYSLFPQ